MKLAFLSVLLTVIVFVTCEIAANGATSTADAEKELLVRLKERTQEKLRKARERAALRMSKVIWKNETTSQPEATTTPSTKLKREGVTKIVNQLPEPLVVLFRSRFLRKPTPYKEYKHLFTNASDTDAIVVEAGIDADPRTVNASKSDPSAESKREKREVLDTVSKEGSETEIYISSNVRSSSPGHTSRKIDTARVKRETAESGNDNIAMENRDNYQIDHVQGSTNGSADTKTHQTRQIIGRVDQTSQAQNFYRTGNHLDTQNNNYNINRHTEVTDIYRQGGRGGEGQVRSSVTNRPPFRPSQQLFEEDAEDVYPATTTEDPEGSGDHGETREPKEIRLPSNGYSLNNYPSNNTNNDNVEDYNERTQEYEYDYEERNQQFDYDDRNESSNESDKNNQQSNENRAIEDDILARGQAIKVNSVLLHYKENKRNETESSERPSNVQISNNFIQVPVLKTSHYQKYKEINTLSTTTYRPTTAPEEDTQQSLDTEQQLKVASVIRQYQQSAKEPTQDHQAKPIATTLFPPNTLPVPPTSGVKNYHESSVDKKSTQTPPVNYDSSPHQGANYQNDNAELLHKPTEQTTEKVFATSSSIEDLIKKFTDPKYKPPAFPSIPPITTPSSIQKEEQSVGFGEKFSYLKAGPEEGKLDGKIPEFPPLSGHQGIKATDFHFQKLSPLKAATEEEKSQKFDEKIPNFPSPTDHQGTNAIHFPHSSQQGLKAHEENLKASQHHSFEIPTSADAFKSDPPKQLVSTFPSLEQLQNKPLDFGAEKQGRTLSGGSPGFDGNLGFNIPNLNNNQPQGIPQPPQSDNPFGGANAIANGLKLLDSYKPSAGSFNPYQAAQNLIDPSVYIYGNQAGPQFNSIVQAQNVPSYNFGNSDFNAQPTNFQSYPLGGNFQLFGNNHGFGNTQSFSQGLQADASSYSGIGSPLTGFGNFNFQTNGEFNQQQLPSFDLDRFTKSLQSDGSKAQGLPTSEPANLDVGEGGNIGTAGTVTDTKALTSVKGTTGDSDASTSALFETVQSEGADEADIKLEALGPVKSGQESQGNIKLHRRGYYAKN